MRPQLSQDGLYRRRIGLLLLDVERKPRIERLLRQLLAIDEQFGDKGDVVVCIVVNVHVDLLLLDLLLHLALLCPDPCYFLLVRLEELSQYRLQLVCALCFIPAAYFANQDGQRGHNVLIGLIILPVDDLLRQHFLYYLS